ncbi:MAG: tetratricopeptide repeat protein, partial [Ferruginibacter sp.]
LDSVIFKSTAGILLHDLRNDWIDNMYLLMGKAYFLRKDFDSAAATFQFINYNLFPRKKNEDDSRIIGTNDDANRSIVSIANKEKQNILQKLTAQPPSRNDALIWMSRTLIEQNELGEAASLINILQHDPNLPNRLKNDLNEVNAYWFYKQESYDSAAVYLEKALSNADTKQDKARSEFLLGQLYSMSRQFDKATTFYEKSSKHTVDPILDIYARLNNATMMKSSTEKEMNNSIDNLLKMARKDKFEIYKDLIYFSAGEIALQKPDTNTAVILYNKSVKFNIDNVVYKNKSLLKLADIAYQRRQYKLAYACYDSLQSGDTTIEAQLSEIQSRRNALSKVVQHLSVIEKQDSLQKVAALPIGERESFVKKLAKKYRKEKGLKEEDNNAGGDMIAFNNNKEQSADLFSNNTKGEWYFYNASLRSKGLTEFKRKWGTRTNADNWRRKNASGDNTGAQPKNNAPQMAPDMGVGSPDDPISANPTPDEKKPQPKTKEGAAPVEEKNQQPEDFSYEGLMSNLPLTPEKITASNELIAVNLFELAKVYHYDLNDYNEAIDTYESSLKRFPDSLYNGDLYFGLSACYAKIGDMAKSNFYKNLLTKQFPTSKSAIQLNNPTALKPGNNNDAGTKKYESIYNLFIEGKFDEAFSEKKKADSIYGNNYWSPQLLYIEAVYHIRQKDDSVATNVLKNIVSLHPQSKLVKRAENLIEVLKRRKEIETYLQQLEVTRAKDDEVIITREPAVQKAIVTPVATNKDSVKTAPVAVQTPKADTVVKVKPPVVSGPFTFVETAPHFVLMVLDKVDGTYINESKNAFTRFCNENFRQAQLQVEKDALDQEKSLLVFSSFADAAVAMDFYTRVKRAAPEEVSWLPASKYSFLIISAANLELLKANKNIEGYKLLLKKQYPNQF